MASNSPSCSLFVNTALLGWFEGLVCQKSEFHHFTVTIRVSRVSIVTRVNRVSVVRVSITFRISLVLVIGWG